MSAIELDLQHLNRVSVCCIRPRSLGPCFGLACDAAFLGMPERFDDGSAIADTGDKIIKATMGAMILNRFWSIKLPINGVPHTLVTHQTLVKGGFG